MYNYFLSQILLKEDRYKPINVYRAFQEIVLMHKILCTDTGVKIHNAEMMVAECGGSHLQSQHLRSGVWWVAVSLRPSSTT